MLPVTLSLNIWMVKLNQSPTGAKYSVVRADFGAFSKSSKSATDCNFMNVNIDVTRWNLLGQVSNITAQNHT